MKDDVIGILQSKLIGDNDNLARARAVFGNMSDAELDTEYGESGRTCRQVRDHYVATQKKTYDCIVWVEAAAELHDAVQDVLRGTPLDDCGNRDDDGMCASHNKDGRMIGRWRRRLEGVAP